MLSPGKILFTIALVAVVIFLFRIAGRRKKSARTRDVKEDKTLDLRQCPKCGDFVEKTCDRPDCPIT